MMFSRRMLANPQHCRRNAGSPVFAIACLLVWILPAKAEEKIDVPPPTNVRAIAHRIQTFSHSLSREEYSYFEVLEDASLHRELFDIRWQIGQVLNSEEDLAGLSQYGVRCSSDRTCSLDVERFPFWDFPEDRIRSLFDTASAEGTIALLREKGVAESDLAALRHFLKQRDPKRAALTAAYHIAKDLSDRVLRDASSKEQPLTRSVGIRFAYENSLTAKKAYRSWALQLLNSLQPNERKILESLAVDLNRRLSISGENIEKGLRSTQRSIISGEYLKAYESVNTEVTQ